MSKSNAAHLKEMEATLAQGLREDAKTPLDDHIAERELIRDLMEALDALRLTASRAKLIEPRHANLLSMTFRLMEKDATAVLNRAKEAGYGRGE